MHQQSVGRAAPDRDGSIAISLVIPIFDVAAYLPALLDSLSAQEEPGCAYEMVFVDDGSRDDSARIVLEWMATSTARTRLLSQANAGVSAARNAGLAVANGVWVTFPDADDVLDRRYLQSAWRFLRSRDGQLATIVASRVIRLDDRSDQLDDSHPLRFRFDSGARVIRMNDRPDYFQLHAASTFFRTADLADHRFPVGVHASEDALFIAHHLLRHEDPLLGVNPHAVYLYRRRATGDSATDSYRRDPERAYRDRFGRDYLDVLTEAARRGAVPRWLQSMILYEFQWVLPDWRRIDAPRSTVSEQQGRDILSAIAACSGFIEDDVILGYDATALPLWLRYVLLALKGSPLPDWNAAIVDAVDGERNRTRLRRYVLGVGEPPARPGEAGAEAVICFAPTDLAVETYWVAGTRDELLRSTWEMDDALRRDAVSQTRLALPSRMSDVRVRRVRIERAVVPVRALAKYLSEAARRSGLSRTGATRLAAHVLRTVRLASTRQVVLSTRADGPAVKHARATGGFGLRISPSASSGAVGLLSLRALAAVSGGATIVTDDVRALSRLKIAVRPRASRWNAICVVSPTLSYDDRLALAESSAAVVLTTESAA